MVLESSSLGLELAAELIARTVELGRPQGVATGPLLRPASPERAAGKAERTPLATEIWGAAPPGPSRQELPTPSGSQPAPAEDRGSGQ